MTIYFIGADFGEVDEDSNFSVFRVWRFTEWPGPFHWIAFPVESLPKPSFTECLSYFHWKPPLFYWNVLRRMPSPKSRLLGICPCHEGSAIRTYPPAQNRYMQEKNLGELIFASIHAGPVFALTRIQENVFEGSSSTCSPNSWGNSFRCKCMSRLYLHPCEYRKIFLAIYLCTITHKKITEPNCSPLWMPNNGTLKGSK